MARATITFEDSDDDGGVNVRIEFDPPAIADAAATPAQMGAMKALYFLKRDDAVDEWREEWDGDEIEEDAE